MNRHTDKAPLSQICHRTCHLNKSIFGCRIMPSLSHRITSHSQVVEPTLITDRRKLVFCQILPYMVPVVVALLILCKTTSLS